MLDGMDEEKSVPENLWISMAFEPRKAIHSIAQEHPLFGFWLLSTVYGIASSFHTANFYSWGLSFSFLSIVLPLLLFAPLLGAANICLDAGVLRLTASWFGPSRVSFSQLKTAVAWSKVPSFLGLMMWVLLSVTDAETVFIHYASSGSAVMIIFITLILSSWSFVLLAQTIRELQSSTLLQAFGHVLLTYLISFILYLFALFAVRYIYISLI